MTVARRVHFGCDLLAVFIAESHMPAIEVFLMRYSCQLLI